ncbi:MAG: CPBP family intramembrane glutamic endopeptidase [Betaproteobacteria bacterium]
MAYPLAAAMGFAAACVCYFLGEITFGNGADNWFVSIASSYRDTVDTRGMDMLTLYLVFTLPALFFSPIGEEMFFRGVLQDALQEVWSVRTSTIAEAALFGGVHLCHHGLSMSAAGLTIRTLSGAMWVALMFLVALLFAWLRSLSGSLFPAMVAHAIFNATMNWLILAMLWN